MQYLITTPAWPKAGQPSTAELVSHDEMGERLQAVDGRVRDLGQVYAILDNGHPTSVIVYSATRFDQTQGRLVTLSVTVGSSNNVIDRFEYPHTAPVGGLS